MQPASIVAKTDGSCLLPTRPAGAAPKVPQISKGPLQKGRLLSPCGSTPRLLKPRRDQIKECGDQFHCCRAAVGGVQKSILSFARAEQYSEYSLMAPHGDRGRGPGDLEVNCPAGAREGGLGRWVLSFSGKYRAAGLTSHRLLLSQHIRT